MSETNNFITHFEVSNFKKFDHLVVEDIGQFNLITGDNNVGKTSLLEALTMNIDDNQELIFKLHHLLCERGTHYHVDEIFSANPKIPNINYFEKIKKSKKIPIIFTFNNRTIKIEDDVFFNFSEEEIKLNKRKKYRGFENELKYWIRIFRDNKLVDVQWLYEDDYYSHTEDKIKFNYKPIVGFSALINTGDLIHYQNEIKNNNSITNANDQNEIVRILRSIILSDIISITSSLFNNGKTELITVATESSAANFVPLSQYGDGVQKIVRYVLEMYYVNRHGYNFICLDEVEAGIHFSRLKIFWKEFLSLCKELKIQLFATTHSQECIEAYAQALEELGMEEDGRLITLKEKDGEIFANTKKYEVFKYGLENGYNGLG